MRKKLFLIGPTRAAKAEQKFLVHARQTQPTNQGRTPFICTLWVPVHLCFNSQQGPTLGVHYNPQHDGSKNPLSLNVRKKLTISSLLYSLVCMVRAQNFCLAAEFVHKDTYTCTHTWLNCKLATIPFIVEQSPTPFIYWNSQKFTYLVVKCTYTGKKYLFIYYISHNQENILFFQLFTWWSINCYLRFSLQSEMGIAHMSMFSPCALYYFFSLSFVMLRTYCNMH